MQRGYKPAIEKSKEIKAVLKEIDALDELRRELLERIEELSDGVVTLTELRRDLRFRGTALIILKRFRLLPTISNTSVRPIFDLKRALRIRILLPVFTSGVSIRTVRKRSKIGSIVRDYVLRVIGHESSVRDELSKQKKLEEAA